MGKQTENKGGSDDVANVVSQVDEKIPKKEHKEVQEDTKNIDTTQM